MTQQQAAIVFKAKKSYEVTVMLCENEATIRKAQAMAIGKDDEQVRDWLLKNGKFSRSEITEAIATAKQEEGQCVSLWDAVQGLTAYARGFDFVDARVDLETRAGKLLEGVQ